MGKSGLGAGAQSASASAGEQENAGEVAPSACCSVSGVCLRSTLKWIIAVVLGMNLLLFAIFSLPVFGKGHPAGKQGSESPQIQIEASFSLEKPVSDVKANAFKLESDIWAEIGVQNAKVTIISLEPLAPNWTQVVIGVSPNPKNSSMSLADLSVLRSNLKTLVLQDSELNLTPDLFGKVYQFQLLKFPGGITVAPEQSGFPLQQILVLFNFTLNYSIFRVDKNLDELKHQLKLFLNVRSSENLFVQLTNSNGSTVDPPIIVQTTVMSVVGTGLPSPRLKQLAQDITGSPAKNLGLNHTTFGNVKQIQLSSYLQYSLTPPPYGAPSPAPSVPSPFAAPPSYYPAPHSHHHHHHHHHLTHSPPPQKAAPHPSPYHKVLPSPPVHKPYPPYKSSPPPSVVHIKFPPPHPKIISPAPSPLHKPKLPPPPKPSHAYEVPPPPLTRVPYIPTPTGKPHPSSPPPVHKFPTPPKYAYPAPPPRY